jgi:hypothetical protein
MKRLSIISLMLMALLLGSFMLNTEQALAVDVGNDVIDFIEVRYDFPAPGVSTWYYRVLSGSQPSISHVTFELGECLQIVDAGTWDGIDPNNMNSGGGTPVPGSDPTTGITGLKFDQGFQDGEERFYYFTVDGNYAPESIIVASKGGPDQAFDTALIEGPAPDCSPPPDPGKIIIRKVTDPFGWNEFVFPFDGPDGTFSVLAGQIEGMDGEDTQWESSPLPPGPYMVTEMDPSGLDVSFLLVAIDCDDENSRGSVGDLTAYITLDPGETVICTFKNEKKGTSAVTMPADAMVAAAQGSQVTVQWTTASEIDNAGFNIYRSRSAEGPWVQVNETLIAAQGDASYGATYKFEDRPGYGAFYYQIEDVDYNGQTNLNELIETRVRFGLRRPAFRPQMPTFWNNIH